MNQLKSIFHQLAGVGVYTTLQSSVKLVGNYIVGKLAAIYLGTAGFAILGQFQNLVVLFQNLSNGALQSGLIKHVAEYRDGPRWPRFIRTAFSISIISALALALLLMLFHRTLNDIFLDLPEPFLPFLALSVSMVFFSLNLLLIAVFSGMQDYRSLAFFHVLQTMVMVGLFVGLLIDQGLEGAMLAVSIYSIVSFLLSILLFRKRYSSLFTDFKLEIDRRILSSLASYSLMGLFTIAAASLTLLWLRTYVIDNISVEVAGLWEGLNRISNFYIYFLAVIFSAYILPRYSKESVVVKLRVLVRQHFELIFPLVSTILLGVFLLGRPLVRFIFTDEFLPMLEALPFHLLGDGFKVLAWVLSNLLVARKQISLVILNESVYFVALIVMSMLVGTDLIGMAQAYAISGLLYFIGLGITVNRTLRIS